MPTELWKSLNYKTQYKYFINTFIREYDLSKANISALLYTKRISVEDHKAYLAMDKNERETKIGLWIKRDKSVYKDIQKGIIEAKRRLVFANNIEDFEVVSVKNDAMFIAGRNLVSTVFPPFEFKIKNVYTVYLQAADLEIYYGDNVDPISGIVNTNIDVKGIGDDMLILHQDGMLDLICNLCYKLQREDIKDTMKWMSQMYEAFVTRSLPKQYYRNFDSFSGYTINTFYRVASLGEIDDSMIKVVDINRNLLILRDLMSIVSDLYRRSVH
jgi:hypothetical protein